MDNKSFIPADVPDIMQKIFTHHYETITKGTNKLFLFAADQKIEHLNDDFIGNTIATESANPEYLFKLAQNQKIGAFATQLGLIARYGNSYQNIPYIIKLNSKTNLIAAQAHDPYSKILWNIEDVVTFKKESAFSICGIGYTIYLGSAHEGAMLQEAAQLIFKAHQQGLVTILWVYPRGKNVTREYDSSLAAGAAGVATCLGADFVKIQVPESTKDQLETISQAAGKTKVIAAGGPQTHAQNFLEHLSKQLDAGFAGCAVGRNIFQRSYQEAQHLIEEIGKLIYQ